MWLRFVKTSQKSHKFRTLPFSHALSTTHTTLSLPSISCHPSIYSFITLTISFLSSAIPLQCNKKFSMSSTSPSSHILQICSFYIAKTLSRLPANGNLVHPTLITQGGLWQQHLNALSCSPEYIKGRSHYTGLLKVLLTVWLSFTAIHWWEPLHSCQNVGIPLKPLPSVHQMITLTDIDAWMGQMASLVYI